MYKNYFKRFLDFWIALIALICLSPILIVVTIWLYFANKGAGVFFLQERPGKGEKIFKVIKFKSMTDEKDADGNLKSNAERITPAGQFIRKTSLDELPQMFNVIRGDMALIGPRPLLVKYLPYYTDRERLRHSVRPGITGYAQTHGRNNLSWDDRLAMDVYYVEHLSIWMDIKIFILTIKNIISRKDINVITGISGAVKRLNLDEERKDNINIIYDEK